LTTPCRLCTQLPGCLHLLRGGQFIRARVLDEDTNPGVCEDYACIGDQEGEAREVMQELFEDGYLKALHCHPRESLNDIKEEDVEVPDFAGMILDDTTPEARLDQLLYLTDDEGEFIQEAGKKIPRGELPVRKYAADPEGPIGSPKCDTIAYWDFDKVLDEIVRAEKKLGWLAGSKKAKKTTNKKAGKKPAKKEEKKNMPATDKPKVLLRRPVATKKSKAKKGKTNGEDKTPAKVAGKVAKPATGKKRGRKKATESAPEAAAPAEAGSVDLSGIEERIEAVEKGQAEIGQKMDLLLGAIGAGPADRSIAETLVDGLTVLHDSLQQKVSNLYFAVAVDEDGESPEAFPFLDPEEEDYDGRDCAQNLLEGDDPTDIFAAYLDGPGEGEADEED
jgi:hypothetical protein